MGEREKFITARDFLGAEERVKPISSEGRAVVLDKDLFWCEPPFEHEQALAFAWVRSVEEMAQGGIFNQYLRDISTLFLWISLGCEEKTAVEDFEKRRTRPPLLSDENRRGVFIQAKGVLSLLGKEGRGQEVMAMLEEDLEILWQAGVFRLSKWGLRSIEKNIGKELQKAAA